MSTKVTTTPDWPQTYGRIVLNEVDSTLDEAQRQFPALTQKTWFLAHHQSGARGRRGRAWDMPAGNFAGTLAVQDPTPSTLSALRSFVAALALYDALVVVTGRPDSFALKWPNDVLLNGGKVAGILLESISQKNAIVGIAVGIGVNLAGAPHFSKVEERALRPVSVAGEFGIAVGAEDFLDILAPIYARYETQLIQLGFGPIREAWLARATKLGEVITARLPNEEITGTFETLDENGYLILKTSKERRKIAAADIFF
ncbi:biotin--[acetyl-CoA-carboxylase] ligase [Rhodobacteraceae bacterium S2214]|nr:biotin--[acetyl-CoA-carboxylase] ligase [Rhodobacteraceae bacterium S2214]